MPKVSIIIPALNCIKYLEDCIDSVVNQTLSDIEIIPVDAGSTDGTWELFQNYAKKDSRIRLIKSEYKSHGHQCNLGMEAATGEYIGFVETDDYIELNMFETLYVAATESKADWVKSCYSQFITVDDERFHTDVALLPQYAKGLYNSLIDPREHRTVMTSFGILFMWNGLYCREFLRSNNVKLNETPGAAFQDTGFLNQVIMRAEKVFLIPKSFYRYRRDNEGSSNFSTRCLQFVCNEFEYLLSYFKQNTDLIDIWLPYIHRRDFNTFEFWMKRFYKTEKCPDEVRDCMERFAALLVQSMSMMGTAAQSRIKKWVDPRESIFVNNLDDYYHHAYLENKTQISNYQQGLEICKSYPNVIIFGAGKVGAHFYLFLRRMGIINVACFCDNDEKKQGSSIFGVPVYSVKEAMAEFPTACYMVASANHTQTIIWQLQRDGIRNSQIYSTDSFLPSMGEMLFFNPRDLLESGRPKISVVIPVYNADRYLIQCIDSVLNQPFKDLEIICVNDGSTDESPRILDDYARKDSRLKVLHQLNINAGVARNRGLEAARGEYIHFLDSDDYLTENAYENSYRIAHENKIDYLRGKGYSIDAFSGETLDGTMSDRYAQKMMSQEDYIKPFSINEHPEKLVRYPVYAPWCGLYRREFLIMHGIRFESLTSFDDHSIYYAVVTRAERVLVADVFMVTHRSGNPDSLVGNHLYRFNGHIVSFNTIRNNCLFLPQSIYNMILSEELNSIFSWYNLSISKNVNIENVRNSMIDFVRSFDIAPLKDEYSNTRWYADYLMLKWEVMKLDGKLSEAESENMISELREKSWKSIPLPLENINPKSKIALYGAGKIGKRTYRLFKASRFCDIVLWVDKDYLQLKSSDLPICDPECLKCTEYDYVLVAVKSPQVASEISFWLTSIGVPKDKIISNAEV